MRINLLEWWRERRQQGRLTKVLNRIADKRELQEQHKKLKVEVERIQAELWARGFNVIKASSVNDRCDNARFYAMTPNGRPVEINVGINGGFRMGEVLTK